MSDSAIIVIGSGPSGAMAAYQLVQKGLPVIMLESGEHFPDGLLVRMFGRNVYRHADSHGFEVGKRFVATGNPRAEWFANLSLGGLSNQWTGAVPRFAPQDFSEGERLDERYRWPIQYTDLVPYYEEVERLLCITGGPADIPNLPVGKFAYHVRLPRDWEEISRYALARGQGLTSLPLANGAPWMVTRQATAFNSFNNIVRTLQHSPHFQLITGAHVLRLEWSPVKHKVTSVIYASRADGTQHQLPAAAVVVACGPLQSTKLLFDSACADFPNGLGNTNGLLGCYLHDHPREWWSFELNRPIAHLPHAAYLSRAPYRVSEPLLASSWTIGHASQKDKLLSFLPARSHTFGVQVFGTMVPVENNYVRPDPREKDEFGLPLMDLSIRFDKSTQANIHSARARLLSLMDDAGYRPDLSTQNQTLTPGSSVHYGGTIRMHSSRKYGLLDARCRLHDVPNLVVADASSFTTGPEKNPTLTAMAIASRAMDYLAADRNHL